MKKVTIFKSETGITTTEYRFSPDELVHFFWACDDAFEEAKKIVLKKTND